MTTTVHAVEHEALARKFFYGFFALYVAFMIIFAKENNDIIANLTGAAMVASFILYHIFFRVERFYFNTMLLIYFLFYLLCALSLTWTIDVDYSRYTILRMTQIFINLIFLYNILKTFKIHEAIFVGLMIGTYFNLLLALGVLSVDAPIYWARRFIGTTMISNAIGVMVLFSLVGSIVLLQSAKNKLWIIVNLGNMLAAYYIIILTASRSSLVISSLVILVFMVQMFLQKSTRIYLFIALGLITIAALYVVNLNTFDTELAYALNRLAGIFGTISGQSADSSTTERFLFLKIMVQVFKENPFWGTGVNTSRVFLHGFYSHNNYIEILAATGIIGAVLYYSMHFSLFTKIHAVKAFWMRNYMYLFLIVLLLDDMAAVTFYSKMTLMILLLLYVMAEEKSKNTKYK